MKRLFDFGAALIILLILSPVLLIVAILIRYYLGSPVIFTQQRPGFNGRPFIMYKFRTMRNTTDAEGKMLSDEQRITKLGRFLRSASIDELPELFNVLKGDMSLVGPRPLLMQYLELYTPQQARRHEVRPGITGWAQVNGRNAISWEQKFDYDVWYVDHRNLLLDFKILLLTVKKVFIREGISSKDAVGMKEFTGTNTDI